MIEFFENRLDRCHEALSTSPRYTEYKLVQYIGVDPTVLESRRNGVETPHVGCSEYNRLFTRVRVDRDIANKPTELTN